MVVSRLLLLGTSSAGLLVVLLLSSTRSTVAYPSVLPRSRHPPGIVRPKENGASSSLETRWSTLVLKSTSSQAASDLLYEDQRQAMARRSAEEEALLMPRAQELLPAKLKLPKASAGKGFGASGTSNNNKALSPVQTRLGVAQAKILKKDGVLRIANALDPTVADALRTYVLQQEVLAEQATTAQPNLSQSFFGVENARKSRCDLQLCLLRPDHDNNDPKGLGTHVVADALQGLLGSAGSLRPVYEQLVTLEGEFYELAAVITHKGSDRQQIHPDLPFRPVAPLYVVFCALQDVTVEMGPTTFLLGTHTATERARFDGDLEMRNQQLAEAQVRLATLHKGDAVVFDARILHCGNANQASSRALFNFSFLSKGLTGTLRDYPGSIRPGYCGRLSLGSLAQHLADYEAGNPEPFLEYGNGLL